MAYWHERRLEPVRIAVVGLGYWGPNLVRNLHELPTPSSSAVCDLRRGRARARSRAAIPACAGTTSFDEILDDDSIEAVCIATPVATHHPLALRGARRRQARLHREAARRVGRPRRADLDRSSPNAADRVLMPGHTFLYSPPVNMIRELIESRRARRHLLRLDEPREPRPPPAGRERRLGSRPARLLDPPLLARRDAGARQRDQPRLRASRHARRRVHQSRVRLGDRSRTSSCRGSRRASCAGRRSSARARWSSTTTRANEPVRVFDSGVMLPRPGDVRRVPADLPHRRHRLAARRRGRAAARSSWPTSATRSAPAAPRARRLQLGLDVVRMIEAVDASLAAGGAASSVAADPAPARPSARLTIAPRRPQGRRPAGAVGPRRSIDEAARRATTR